MTDFYFPGMKSQECVGITDFENYCIEEECKYTAVRLNEHLMLKYAPKVKAPAKVEMAESVVARPK
jgi:hypothetical protein